MENSVTIKGNKNGIVCLLDADMTFSDLKEKVAQKFADSAKFLGNCKTAISFEGRDLTFDEELELVGIINANSELDIVCILGNEKGENTQLGSAGNRQLSKEREKTGTYAVFQKGNLRSGQVMEFNESIILIGDVNPGATIKSNGNIIILGALKGMAYAGADGNRDAFVFALDMCPMQIKIADVIARSPDSSLAAIKNASHETKIAFLEDESIYIELASREILSGLQIEQ